MLRWATTLQPEGLIIGKVVENKRKAWTRGCDNCPIMEPQNMLPEAGWGLPVVICKEYFSAIFAKGELKREMAFLALDT